MLLGTLKLIPPSVEFNKSLALAWVSILPDSIVMSPVEFIVKLPPVNIGVVPLLFKILTVPPAVILFSGTTLAEDELANTVPPVPLFFKIMFPLDSAFNSPWNAEGPPELAVTLILPLAVSVFVP